MILCKVNIIYVKNLFFLEVLRLLIKVFDELFSWGCKGMGVAQFSS